MVALVVKFGWWFGPCAVIVIANRQRSLGNILHDAGHSNLHRSRKINDTLTATLVAPLIFADIGTYRELHLRHHRQLGSYADPDKLNRAAVGSWLAHFCKFLFDPKLWLGSVAGHFSSACTAGSRKFYIICWWTLVCSLIWVLAGWNQLATFLALWMLARATVFHAITVFREMCDHYGLVEGGIFSFSRDIFPTSIWYHLVHPRNNGYHLTHHLLPVVPYYRLPQAQRLISMTPIYRKECHVCDSYVFGKSPVVRRWRSEC